MIEVAFGAVRVFFIVAVDPIDDGIDDLGGAAGVHPDDEQGLAEDDLGSGVDVEFAVQVGDFDRDAPDADLVIVKLNT